MNGDDKENYWQPEDAPEGNDIQTVAEVEEPAASSSAQDTVDDAPVTWTAQEYIHIEKGGLWYVLFAFVALGLIALDIFVLRSYTFSALVIVMAIAIIVYSRRPPHTIQYALSTRQGLYIGEKLYPFADFKAFGLVQDGVHHSIMLIPTRRFGFGVSVYFPEESGEQIVDILGTRLPMRPLKLDPLDRLIRQLRL